MKMLYMVPMPPQSGCMAVYGLRYDCDYEILQHIAVNRNFGSAEPTESPVYRYFSAERVQAAVPATGSAVGCKLSDAPLKHKVNLTAATNDQLIRPTYF